MRSMRRQRGISLIELLLAIAVVLVITGIGIVAYAMTRNSAMAYQTNTALSQVRAGIKSAFKGTDYGSLTVQALINAEKVPEGIVSGANLVGPWGGAITIGPATYHSVNNAGWSMQLDRIPKEICPEVLYEVSDQYQRVQVGTQVIKDHSVAPAVPHAGQAAIQTACQQDEVVTIQLLSN